MVRENEIRAGEMQVALPQAGDAGIFFIGRIRTPWTDRMRCPRQGRWDGPLCRIELFEPWVQGLDGIEAFSSLEILYWLDRSSRDIVRQSPANNGRVHGVFSLRSPVRPNPIGTSLVACAGREGNTVLVHGLDCLDGTPLVDIKPDRCQFTPIAPPQPGDFETDPALKPVDPALLI